ncbi:uncharacterized protein [Penaeus vannamei]|uniref:uncharacterized protein isoform X2 n=1 Tax=Penaeus vannamei TaxID=6689 RepID=UPI00387F881B
MYCGVILTLVAVAAKESAERGNIVMKMMIMMIQARRGIVKIPSSLNSPHVLMMAIMMVYQTDKGECLSGDLHLPLEQALRTQPPLPRPDASDTPEGGSNFYTRGEPPHKRTLLITRSERERQRTDDDTQGLARHLSALGTLKDRGFIGILYLPSVINLQFRISFIHVHYGHPFSFISGAKRWSYVHN